jgi:hypothetical protein
MRWCILVVAVGCAPSLERAEIELAPMAAEPQSSFPTAVAESESASVGSVDSAATVEVPVDRRPALRPVSPREADYGLAGLERARRALADKTAIVGELFAAAGAHFPPEQLLLRAFKEERELEIWAPSAPNEELVQVTSYAICAASGKLGPKRREGDRQVPEGFYTIQYLWPQSAFYLALRVGYPNHSDRILGHPTSPGGDIMIHGACASIGCLAMSDERIQEIWVMASAAQAKSRVAVHIFPSRERPLEGSHQAFWENLYEGKALFDRERRLPVVRVDARGRYLFESE